jgi:hypothetical protein
VAYERDPKAIKNVVIALLIVMPLMFYACYAIFLAGLDLLVDELGVARILDGRKFKRLEWSDIESIKDVVLVSSYGRKNRFLTVLSRPSRKVFWGRARKLVINGNDIDNFPLFVRVMNEKLRLHGIKVKCSQGGELRSCDEISI